MDVTTVLCGCSKFTMLKATDIEWDVDSKKGLDSLPTEIILPIGMTDVDEISDYISEETGFCHKGFGLEIVNPE